MTSAPTPTRFETPFRSLNLERFPRRKNELLQAWDTADELILKHLAETYPNDGLRGKRVLILNDSFGALGCALADFDVSSYTDSTMAAQAMALNGQRAQSLSKLGELSGIYDLVLARIPKNMSFFEDQLAHLSAHLGKNSEVICGYMVKHQANSSFELLAKYLGETRTSLATKKARLIFARFERAAQTSPYPKEVRIESFEHAFLHHSNLFSRERLDIGTRFFLEHVPTGSYPTILDLGCANGIVGIRAKQLNPGARIIFSDESQMAVQSAEANYARFFPGEPADFHWAHCCAELAPSSVELVLCNPPFHLGNAQGDLIAWQMFADSLKVLVPGGTLRVIGNTHLLYPAMLKKLFGNSRVVATNPKFTIADATKR